MKTAAKNEWRETTLGEVARVKGGKRLPLGSDLTALPTSHPYIRVRDLNNGKIADDLLFVPDNVFPAISRYTVSEGDIVLSIVGTIGLLARVNQKHHGANLTENCVKIVDFAHDTDADFLFYFLQSDRGQGEIKKNTVGAVQAKLPIYGVENISLLLPNLSEQKSMVAVLRSLDDKIELLRKQNETLERIAQTVFNERFVKPAYGSFPDDWREGKVRDVVEIFDTKRIPLSSEQRANRKGKYPYYGATTVMDHVDDYLFDGIYLLLAEDGSVADGRGYPVLQYVWGQFWVNNHAHILQGRNGFSTEMLYLFFRNKKVSEIITGAVQLKINQGNLLNVDIAIPPATILNTLNDFLNPLFTKVRANSNSILTLEHVRNLLLPRLMDGQLRVSN